MQVARRGWPPVVQEQHIVHAALVKGMRAERYPWSGDRVCHRLAAVADTSCVRANRVLETIFYAVMFVPCSFALGTLVDVLFPLPRDGCEGTWKKAWYMALQLVLAAVAVVYVRKVAHVAKYSAVRCREYRPHHHVNEYWGEVTLATVFIGTQRNLMSRIGALREQVSPQRGRMRL